MIFALLKFLELFEKIIAKHSKDNYSIPLIKKLYDAWLNYTPYKTCESSFAYLPFTVVFNPVKDISTGITSKTKNLIDNHLPVQDVFVRFLNKLQEAKEF